MFLLTSQIKTADEEQVVIVCLAIALSQWHSFTSRVSRPLEEVCEQGRDTKVSVPLPLVYG